METFAQLKELAIYIDQGLKLISEISETKRWEKCQSDEENFMDTLNQSIDEHFQEISKMTSIINSLDGLGDIVSNTRYALDELKKYGVLCGMPISLAPNNEITYPRNSQVEKQVTPISSPMPIKKSTPIRNTKPNEPMFREITASEFQSLPSIIPLLIKIEEMNKHYQKIIENGIMKISSDDLAETVPLTSSRLNAFTRALISLNRMSSFEENGQTFYQLL